MNNLFSTWEIRSTSKESSHNVLNVYLISLFFSLKCSHLERERYALTIHLLLVNSVCYLPFTDGERVLRGKESLLGLMWGSLDKSPWVGKVEQGRLSRVCFA